MGPGRGGYWVPSKGDGSNGVPSITLLVREKVRKWGEKGGFWVERGEKWWVWGGFWVLEGVELGSCLVLGSGSGSLGPGWVRF